MTRDLLEAENAELQRRLAEAEDTLQAIREGAVDAFVVDDSGESRVYTLEGADRPYRLLIEQTQQGAATLNSAGIITYANLSLAELVRVPLEKLVGLPLADFVYLDSAITYAALMRESLTHGGRAEIRLRRSDGSVLPTFMTLSTLTTDGGSTLGVLITDLTAQKHQVELARAFESLKRSEVALRESEERYRTLVSVLTDVPWSTNSDGEFVSAQPAWTAYTGQTWEEYRGFGWLDAVHPEDRSRIRESWAQARATGTLFRSHGRLWHWARQAYRYYEAKAIPLHNSEGTVREWVGTCTDVEERKRAEEELRRANADLEQFAYSASHDLQEPIRNISIYGEIIGKRYASALDATGLEYLGFITSGAKRMEALVRDMLAYTQVASVHGQPSGTEEVSTSMALNRALENLSSAIAEANAEISTNELPSLKMSEVQIEQLFQNLIGNAIKYRKDGEAPRIRIEAQPHESYWQFSIADNGIGIEPEFQQKVFGLFRRLHSKEKYSGTGIGLAICQKIVERNGGRIWVESGGVGMGSTFHFTIASAGLKPRN
jgi:PAS domain S-box-containing protein